MALKPSSILPGHDSLPGHEPLQSALQSARNNWDHLLSLSDEDLVAQIAGQRDDNRFEVPAHLIPDGMTYQWCRCEVAGQPDYKNISRWEAAGWQAVPQQRHDGWWMPPGTEGRTITEGMMLMEIPTRIYAAKDYAQKRVARGQVDGMQERLMYGASPGSAPRDAHPRTRPQVKTGWVAGGGQFEVEA